MKHLTTSQICADLPVEIWELILAKIDPYACLIFGRDDIIPKIESLDVRKWLRRAIVKGHLGVVRAFHHQKWPGLETEIVEWLHLKQTEGCTSLAMDVAAGNGHLDVDFLRAGYRP